MNEERLFDGEKFREFLRKNTGYIVLALVACVYVATALIKMEETGKSIAKIIGDGVLCFIVGVVFTSGFSLQGIMKGHDDERVKEAREAHANQVIAAEPYADRLDEWCEKKNALALKRERTKILAHCSMRYSDYFDDDGMACEYVCAECKTKEDRAKERQRYLCYRKALNLKLTPLSASVLTGGSGRADDPHDFGADVDEYERGVILRDIGSKILLGVVFGYYTVAMLSAISIADLIWKLLQVCLFCGSGVLQSQRAYLYMINGYTKRLFQLSGKLKEFISIQPEERQKETKEEIK